MCSWPSLLQLRMIDYDKLCIAKHLVEVLASKTSTHLQSADVMGPFTAEAIAYISWD